jgi:hypothetical protein
MWLKSIGIYINLPLTRPRPTKGHPYSPQHDAITGNSIYDCICNSKTVSPQHDAITGNSIYDCICNSMAFLLMLD